MHFWRQNIVILQVAPVFHWRKKLPLSGKYLDGSTGEKVGELRAWCERNELCIGNQEDFRSRWKEAWRNGGLQPDRYSYGISPVWHTWQMANAVFIFQWHIRSFVHLLCKLKAHVDGELCYCYCCCWTQESCVRCQVCFHMCLNRDTICTVIHRVN